MNGHLIAVEISIESSANQGMNAQGLAFDEHGFKSLDPLAMKRGGPIQQNGVFLDNLFKDLPDLWPHPFHHFFSAFDGMDVTSFLKFFNDEGLKKFQSH